MPHTSRTTPTQRQCPKMSIPSDIPTALIFLSGLDSLLFQFCSLSFISLVEMLDGTQGTTFSGYPKNLGGREYCSSRRVSWPQHRWEFPHRTRSSEKVGRLRNLLVYLDKSESGYWWVHNKVQLTEVDAQ